MYRYFLFYCPYYYPGGGMRDCDLKTNNIDELIPFINTNYNDAWMSHIHYYDTVEDKSYDAEMEEYENEEGWTRQRFLRWKENKR